MELMDGWLLLLAAYVLYVVVLWLLYKIFNYFLGSGWKTNDYPELVLGILFASLLVFLLFWVAARTVGEVVR